MAHRACALAVLLLAALLPPRPVAARALLRPAGGFERKAPSRALLAVTHASVASQAKKGVPHGYKQHYSRRPSRNKRLTGGMTHKFAQVHVNVGPPPGAKVGWNEGEGTKMVRERKKQQEKEAKEAKEREERRVAERRAKRRAGYT